jgi:hypothetical protein
MNEQCKYCIHKTVCAYKEHYEDAVELYKKAREECAKYPWFKCDIKCIQYQKETLNLREIKNAIGGEE